MYARSSFYDKSPEELLDEVIREGSGRLLEAVRIYRSHHRDAGLADAMMNVLRRAEALGVVLKVEVDFDRERGMLLLARNDDVAEIPFEEVWKLAKGRERT